MVLNLKWIILGLSLLLYNGDRGPLILQYQNHVAKALQKNLDEIENDKFQLSNIHLSYGGTEIYSVNQASNTEAYIYLSEVKSCALNGCGQSETKPQNLNSEYFDLMIICDKNLIIKHIKILDYFSDYGYEVSSKKYLKQYVGIPLDQFSKEQTQVDGISGATVSYNGLINSIIDFNKILKTNKM